jgi:hypothetical protein
MQINRVQTLLYLHRRNDVPPHSPSAISQRWGTSTTQCYRGDTVAVDGLDDVPEARRAGRIMAAAQCAVRATGRLRYESNPRPPNLGDTTFLTLQGARGLWGENRKPCDSFTIP